MKKNHCKVKDHCHYPGKYRSTAHSICDLKYSTPKEMQNHFSLNNKRK